MANEKNLKPVKTKSEARERGRNGGIASGKARREKKTIQAILNELLEGQIKDNAQFVKLANKLGIESDKSIKEVFTIVCLLNSVKGGKLADLETLCRLLGESNAIEDLEDTSEAEADVFGKG